MKFDVSEMKTLNECGKKWQLSSRNAFHLKPKTANNNLFFGSLFHECLATMYLGGDLDKIVTQAVKECEGDPPMQRTIEKMLRGYYDEVLREDLDNYIVLDIEKSVNIPLPELQVFNDDGTLDEEKSIRVAGSVDMVALEKETFEIWYFEHKTCSKFRPDVYFVLDEQPRTYFIDLISYVAMMNLRADEGKLPISFYQVLGLEVGAPLPEFRIGGVYINEVKKLSTKFEYMRRPCKYSDVQVGRFYSTLVKTGQRLKALKEGRTTACASPGYMSCTMCDFASICSTYGYEDVELDELLEEFQEEFEVRTVDHLDEKAERKIEG